MADELIPAPAPTDDLITPKAGAPAPEAEAPDIQLPPELLKVPAMQALMVGKPGAASVNFKADRNLDAAKNIFQHKDALLGAGFGLYRALDGDTGVLFNQLYLNPEELKQADAAGTLMELAPSLRDVNSTVIKASRKDHPTLSHDGVVPKGMKVAAVPPVPQMNAPVAPAPAAALRKALTAKIAGLNPGAPTQGPKPGAGRILNSLSSPVV